MKKLIAYILTAAMLSTLLTACGGQPDAPAAQLASEEEAELTHRLLADWYTYSVCCEVLCGDMLWALSYLDSFLEDHTWDSLQTARAAMAIAKRKAESLAPPEAQMSGEDYHKLVEAGLDVSVVRAESDGIPRMIDDAFLTYRSYRDYLNSPTDAFFQTYTLSQFQNWAGIERRLYELDLLYSAVETDYILLTVDNEEEEARFLEAIAEKCPRLNECREGNPQDAEALEALAVEILNEMEAVFGEFSSNVGQAQANLDLSKDISELEYAGEYIDSMASGLVELHGFPIALPYPDWWYEEANETFTYFWDGLDNGEDRRFVVPGENIPAPPDQYLAEWEAASQQDYLAYLELLERYRIPAQYTTEKEGRYTAYYEFSPVSFALCWEKGTASLYTLDGSVCFAPPWYILYTRRAS